MFPTIYNPNPNATPATEIQLRHRLITNDKLTAFFEEIPKRIEAIESATGVAGELELDGIKADFESLEESVQSLSNYLSQTMDSVTSIFSGMGLIEQNIGPKIIDDNIYSLLQKHEYEISGDPSEELDFGLKGYAQSNASLAESNRQALVELREENQSEHTDINTKISDIQSDIADMGVEILRIDGLEARIDTAFKNLTTEITGCKNRLAGIETRLSTLETKIKELEGN